MKLPKDLKIVGFITHNTNSEGDIFWDEWWFQQLEPIERLDCIQDIVGLTQRRYEQALKMTNEEKGSGGIPDRT